MLPFQFLQPCIVFRDVFSHINTELGSSNTTLRNSRGCLTTTDPPMISFHTLTCSSGRSCTLELANFPKILPSSSLSPIRLNSLHTVVYLTPTRPFQAFKPPSFSVCGRFPRTAHTRTKSTPSRVQQCSWPSKRGYHTLRGNRTLLVYPCSNPKPA